MHTEPLVIKSTAFHIAGSFNKACRTYSASCSVQVQVCKKLLATLAYFTSYVDIATDLGCGTGISTQHLLAHINISQCSAVDIAGDLLKEARQQLDMKVHIIQADFNTILFPSASLDLTFANMSLQWSCHWDVLLETIKTQLRHDGLFAFSLPLSGTFDTLTPSYRNTFMTQKALCQRLKQNGFEMLSSETITIHQDFQTPLAALRSIKAVGANTLLNCQNNHSGLTGKKRLNDFFTFPDCFDLNYEIGLFVAKKKDKKT